MYYTVTYAIGQLDASSQRKDLADFPMWPNRLGTSSTETGKEIGLRLSTSHLSLKPAHYSLQRIHLFSLRCDPASITDPTFVSAAASIIRGGYS